MPGSVTGGGNRPPQRPLRRVEGRRVRRSGDALGAADPSGVERAGRRGRSRPGGRRAAVPLPGLQLGLPVERTAPPGARVGLLPVRGGGHRGGAGRRRGDAAARRRAAGALRPGDRGGRLPLRRPRGHVPRRGRHVRRIHRMARDVAGRRGPPVGRQRRAQHRLPRRSLHDLPHPGRARRSPAQLGALHRAPRGRRPPPRPAGPHLPAAGPASTPSSPRV